MLKFENRPVVTGDFATDPSDAVESPHGPLPFKTREGDIVMKVSLPEGDFFLLYLMLFNGKWLMVSQYLD